MACGLAGSEGVLASGGGHHRQPFYGCACCPTNVVRFVPSVPGYVYATGENSSGAYLYPLSLAGDLGWLYSQDDWYPWIYSFTQGWVYFFRTSEDPRWFYDFDTAAYLELSLSE